MQHNQSIQQQFRFLIVAMLMALTFAVLAPVHTHAQANENACWGQASAVFAQMGQMGEHSSQFPTPRLGLRNLARLLHEEGILPDDSMQSLGAFVAAELGLSIDACQ